MDNKKIQLIGAPCGYHGPYTFFKAFKYFRNGKHKILSLSDFFFVKLWSDLDLMSIGELQLLWLDKNSEQVLASLRLYFLPENTPDGRNDDHGEDEVLAISEKVVLRVEDLLDRIIEDAEWRHGLPAVWDVDCPVDPESDAKSQMLLESAFDFEDIVKEKQVIGDTTSENASTVVVLSFPHYCRYRGIMKRIEGVTDKWARHALVVALGGFASACKDTRVVFCKDTFDYPDLEGHELLCNHLAPNLKGRPRRKRKKRSLSPEGSESNESESSLSTVSSVVKIKPTQNRNGIRCNNLNQPRRSNRVTASVEEKEFMIKLHAFMKSKHMPIGRIPDLGIKELDLYALHMRVKKLGGYKQVTTSRMWRLIYDEMGGDQRRNGGAASLRRHYERLLLPYELNLQDVKAKLFRYGVECKASDPTAGVHKANYSSETDNKNITSGEGKMSALRCVRPKGDRSALDSSSVSILPPDKENIPLSNYSDGLDSKETLGEGSSETKPIPELIDITEQDSPGKIVKTALPALKKRKLEILKEGGLEVTAILSGLPETSRGAITITSERRPSVIQHASDSQISITVTPDVSHLLDSPVDTSPTSTYDIVNYQKRPTNNKQSSNQSYVWDHQRVIQSRSIYSHSESTIYGNPKDDLLPTGRPNRCPIKPTPTAEVEVLDLRMSSAQNPMFRSSRVVSAVEHRGNPRDLVRHLPTKKPTSLPIIDGRTLLGSNLEITVVDVNNKQAQIPQHHRHSNQQRKSSTHRSVGDHQSRTNNVLEFTSSRPKSSQHASSSSNGRPKPRETSNNGRSQQSAMLQNTFPSSYIPQSDSRGKTSSANALPFNMYYPPMYNSQIYPYMPAMQGQPPVPMFASTAENLQLYIDLMNRHHTITQPQPGAAGFLGLPRDGSTSITPVSEATMTPPSK